MGNVREHDTFSIEALIEAQNELNNANFERDCPQRELMERYLSSSIGFNEQSPRYMESFAATRERMINVYVLTSKCMSYVVKKPAKPVL